MAVSGRFLPKTDFPVQRTSARRYEPTDIAQIKVRLNPTPPPQKIDLPV